jgi:type II secretory pathway pseudopilin PulG
VPKRLRDLLADHGKDAAGVIILLVLLLPLLLVQQRAARKSVRGCAIAYANAATAADSARVDARHVPGTIRVGNTCGRLRAQANVPRDTTP